MELVFRALLKHLIIIAELCNTFFSKILSILKFLNVNCWPSMLKSKATADLY